MGRSPCCEKSGVRKGPWSPEEDLLLVSYVHEHGPGNWGDVPASTGLMRCGKSCRLRWTNYLRPGIKRGNFSDREDELIIELQNLLGNRWSTIATYMPDRTDNDIKNYWNIHLKKKLAKAVGGAGSSRTKMKRARAAAFKGQWERRLQTDAHTTRQALLEALSMDSSAPPPSSVKPEPLQLALPLAPAQLPVPVPVPASGQAMYACSIENIERLLEGWMRPNNANGKASAESSMSFSSAVSGGSSEGAWANNYSDMAHAAEGFSWRGNDEGAGGAGLVGPSSYPMLENWLFDDGMEHNDDAGLSFVPLADPGEFF